VTRLEQIQVKRYRELVSRGYTENRVTTRHRYENASRVVMGRTRRLPPAEKEEGVIVEFVGPNKDAVRVEVAPGRRWDLPASRKVRIAPQQLVRQAVELVERRKRNS
jgi:hypothetical protein